VGSYVKKNGFGHEDWNFNFNFASNGEMLGYTVARPSAELAGHISHARLRGRSNGLAIALRYRLAIIDQKAFGGRLGFKSPESVSAR
jgi:hypothetical protein